MAVEMIGEKEVIDITPSMFFTVTLATKQRPTHILVKAESAIAALKYAQETEKAPVVGVHITEYSKYLDATIVDEEGCEKEDTTNTECDLKIEKEN